jgi:diacylglycerol kinase family enzyme
LTSFLDKLRLLQDPDHKGLIPELVIVVMGGDGSLGCFLDDLNTDTFIRQYLSLLIFVPLPYGTGNDLCRALGWAGEVGPWGENLETLAQELVRSKKEQFTIWEVNFHAV